MSKTVAKETLTLKDRLVNVWDWLADRLTLVRVLGGIAMLLGFLHYMPLPQLPIDALIELHGDLAPELVGMGLTIWLIDWAVERRQQQELKRQLTRDLLGNVNDFALRAIRELQEHEWWDEVLREYGNAFIGVQWLKANLYNMDLQKANLSDANLLASRLCRANLRGAVLAGAILKLTWFVEADLQGADLQGADLQAASFREADLINANLRRVRYYSIEQLREAKSLEGATMPDGTRLYHEENNPDGITFEEWAALQEAGEAQADSVDERE